MQPLSLLTGSRVARSPIANAQRCVNYYPELNAKDAPVPVTLYQRPGLRTLSLPGVPGVGRGVFRASNGQGYAVVGQNLYIVGPPPTFPMTFMGKLSADLTTPCYMTDNGIEALLVDGSQLGYTWNLNSNNFQTFLDPTRTFQGATRVDVIDGFIVWNFPGTNEFGSTLEFETTIDPTFVATKANYPDPIQSLIVNHHELVLVGEVTSETWTDIGATLFPFAELPGADHEHGTCAPYSVAGADISVFWLEQNRQGQGLVVRSRGYECTRVSNHELEFAIRQMQLTVGITDAVGYCFQQDGHLFYVLSFPAGDQTWVLDDSSGEWSQWAWADTNANLHRHRAAFFALLYNTNVGQDWETGALYHIDPTEHVDSLVGVQWPIVCIRGFPHLTAGQLNLGAKGLDRPVPWSGERVQVTKFVANLECGNGPLDANGNPAAVILRWSTDRGKTFGQDVLQSSGAPGEWLTQPQWLQQGIARDFVFELQHSINGEAALSGAWIEAKVLDS
jgi:hypothetical protein